MSCSRYFFRFASLIPFTVALLLLFGGCAEPAREVSGPAENQRADAVASASTWIHPAFIVESGKAPLWLELTPAGLEPIPAPGHASLFPFEPWTLSLRSEGMMVHEGRFISAVNGMGFWAALPWQNGRLAFYRVQGKEEWASFRIDSFFLFDGKPSVLLGRDDFFSAGTEKKSLSPVQSLVKGSPSPVPGEIPAFSRTDTEGEWQINSLLFGSDKRWYFRIVREDGDKRDIRYFISEDLSRPALASSPGEYREALRPLAPQEAPELLRPVLERLETDFSVLGEDYIAETISENGVYPRYYGGASSSDSISRVWAYCDSRLAAAVDSRGKGYIRRPGSVRRVEALALPELPVSFAYTGIVFLEKELIASWEEQQDWTVGASGFLIMDIPGLPRGQAEGQAK
ncbi:hypothetical protein LJC14_05865 [Treponema sp. OttesenSCG-928-L16]|nr:hypothetical protein [Treponema sp. OttesenSCG-928-L16]